MSRPLRRSIPPLGTAMASTISIVASYVVGKLPWKAPTSVATTANVTIASALNAGDSIDGVTLTAGDRVLVWQQTDQSENGVYICDASPFRANDFDDSPEIVGAVVRVADGTLYGGETFRNTNTSAVVVDTDDITFELVTAVPPGGDFEGSVRDAGRWEVVMDPATSSPPVAVETVDGTDWVYGWVT